MAANGKLYACDPPVTQASAKLAFQHLSEALQQILIYTQGQAIALQL